MHDDFIRLNPWSVVTWAKHAIKGDDEESEPSATEVLLANLENTLLVNRKPNTRRLTHKVKGRFWVAIRPSVYRSLLIVPMFTPFIMLPAQALAGSGDYKPERVLLTSAVLCLLTMAYLAAFLMRGRRQAVRRRNAVAETISWLYTGTTVFALVLCYIYADDFDIPRIDWYVLPLWIQLALCVASGVYQAKRPPNPVWGHVLTLGSAMAPSQVRYEVHRLHPEDQAWMLDERDQAVRILVDRGVLTGVDPDELATRPLGELHLRPKGS